MFDSVTTYSKFVVFALMGILMTCSPFAASAQTASYQAPRLAAPIALDGKLDEATWKDALVMSDFKWLKTTAQKWEPAQTEARMVWDNDAVYFGVRCDEPKMAALAVSPRERDGMIFADDCIEIFLSPTGQTPTFYQFAVSAANIQADTYWIEGGRIIGQEFNAIWDSAIYKGADFWSAEVRIPLSAFYFTPASAFSETWLVNITRERQPVAELTSWAPVEQRFAEPENYRSVSGLPRKPANLDLRVTGVQPIVAQLDGKSGAGQGVLQLGLSAGTGAAGKYLARVEDDKGKVLLENQPITVAAGEKAVTIENANFPAMGRANLKVSLLTPQSTLAGGAWVTGDVAYRPLVVDMQEPFYANCIFPDQHIKHIKADVQINLPPSELRSATLKVKLAGKDRVIEQFEFPLKSARLADFSISAERLADGDYELEVQVVNGGKQLARQTQIIHKLAPPPGSYLYIDRHLNLVVDGKPTFPRTWMGDDTFLLTQALRENLPHPNSKFVNLWKLLVNVEAARLDSSPEEKANRINGSKPSQKVYDEMQKVIDANRNRKDAWAYYLCDEPESNSISLEYLRQQYNFLKQQDPYHPVIIVSHSPENYVTVCDIVSPDSYLNPQIEADGRRTMTPMKLVGSQQQISLQAGKHRTAVWFTPQAFSYAGWQGRLPNSDYHTFPEYRALVYTAITNGCKGILSFMYADQFSSIELRNGIPFIYESLERLEPFLLSPEPDVPINVQSPENGVNAIVKVRNGQMVLMAVNTLDRPMQATIQGSGLKKWQKLVGFRQTAGAALQNGSLKLSFKPYETQILSSQKLDAGMKTAAAMEREIATARTALKKPGNILYGRGKEIEWDFSDTYAFSALSLHSLTDGITDALGWIDQMNKPPGRVEMAFPTFTPKFSKAKIYSSTAEDVEFWIWKAGDWQKVGEVKGNQSSVIDFDFGKQLSTVKIKIMMTKMHPGMKAEIYEVELY